MREWSTQVYQKLGKADFSFWYNKENERNKLRYYGRSCYSRKGICGHYK